jgi:hypothetical protein
VKVAINSRAIEGCRYPENELAQLRSWCPPPGIRWLRSTLSFSDGKDARTHPAVRRYARCSTSPTVRHGADMDAQPDQR